ncbi:TrbC/VirB2 family protein [Metapseudomonas furukawaii]|nr:TrbC/VirB2 family protein [Pseudomonas furukawaii]
MSLRKARNYKLDMLCLFALMLLVTTLASPDAMASATAGTLPWDSPLAKLRASITGPVAFTISILGLVGTLSALIWGGELSGVLKSVIVIVMIISIIVAANNFLSVMFGVGAEIAAYAPAMVAGIV